MDPGENVMHVVAGPVVESADPFDPASPSAHLARPGEPDPFGTDAGADDPLVPPRGSGLPGWAVRVRGTLRRCALALLPVGLLAALPLHFFVGRVDDTVVAAPALLDLAGGFGLLLLPLMWGAYFAVCALPTVIGLAGTVAIVVTEASGRGLPRPRTVWRLVGYRLRPLWAWFAVFGVLTQSLSLLLTAELLGAAVAVPLGLALGLVSTGVLTFIGVLGCVVLLERAAAPRRALHLASTVPLGGLMVASLAVTVLPRLAGAVAGDLLATAVAVLVVLLWAVAALVTYAQARRAERPVSSGSLWAELTAPEFD
jgi:hypothetical protein